MSEEAFNDKEKQFNDLWDGVTPVIASPEFSIPKSVILTSNTLSISIGVVYMNSVVSAPEEPTFVQR